MKTNSTPAQSPQASHRPAKHSPNPGRKWAQTSGVVKLRLWERSIICALLGFLLLPVLAPAQLPPQRSTVYPLSFSGNVQHPAAVYAPNTAMTVEAWVYRENAAQCETIVSQGFAQSFWFGFCNNSLRFYRSGGTFADAGVNVPAHRWTHVAAVYSLPKGGSGQVEFFLDGSLVATRPLTSVGGGQNLPLTVGGNPGGSYHFYGALDEVRVWSAARTAGQINTSRFQELVTGTALTAVFPGGGAYEAVSTTIATLPAGVQTQVAGILPRDLVVPMTVRTLNADGTPTSYEFEDSEELVVRYLDGGHEVDTVARLIASRDAVTMTTNLWVGLSFPALEYGEFEPANGSVRLYFDPNASGDTVPGFDDLQMIYSAFATPPLRAAGRGIGALGGFGIQSGLEDTLGFVGSRSACNGDLSPLCVEMSVPRNSIMVAGTSEIRFMLDLYRSAAPGILLPAPFDGLSGKPATWPRLRFGGYTSATATSLTLSGTVTNTTTGGGVPGLQVSLYSGDSPSSGPVVATRTTSSTGTFNFNGVTLPNFSYFVVAYEPPGGIALDEQSPALGSPTGRVPVDAILGTRAVRYYSCSSSLCVYQSVNFRFGQIGPVGITSVSNSPVVAPVIVRTDTLKLTPGGQITLVGSNFNSNVKVYLLQPGCPFDPPLCGSDLLPATNNLVRSAGGTRITVDVPVVPGAEVAARSLQVVVENPGYLATGGNRWNYGPSITVTPPPYPMQYGFEFKNEDDSPSSRNSKPVTATASSCFPGFATPTTSRRWLRCT